MAQVSDDRMRVRAQAKWVRTSARKARLVLEHIRGRSVPEARTVLAFSERAVARDVERVLRSAVANAEANHGLVGDDLVVATAGRNWPTTLTYDVASSPVTDQFLIYACNPGNLLAAIDPPSVSFRYAILGF